MELLGASLPNLQELCLDGSQLASLRDLGTELGNLTSLSLADCGLDELDGVAAMPSLRSLRLPGNRIDDLTPLCTHDCLQVNDDAPPPVRHFEEPFITVYLLRRLDL